MNSTNYRDMQVNVYERCLDSFTRAKKVCVGNWDAHEKYPYEQYLLQNYNGSQNFALDFGCGIGRMIKRLLPVFRMVDGADLMDRSIMFAKEYLGKSYKGQLFKTDGLSCKITSSNKYNFIYSTLCFQHIPVHEIRINILKDLFSLLEDGGQLVFQMGFGWDNGIYWNHNQYDSRSTNGDEDFSIPNETHFENIFNDIINEIGFSTVKYSIQDSPHPEIKNYHPNWLFLYCNKNDNTRNNIKP